MATGAVLDTCVLYPFSLSDLLPRLAAEELYDRTGAARISRSSNATRSSTG